MHVGIVREDVAVCGETWNVPSSVTFYTGTIALACTTVQNPYVDVLDILRFLLGFASDGDGCGVGSAPRSFLRKD